MIFTVHTDTCSIHFLQRLRWTWHGPVTWWEKKIVIDPSHHRPLLDGERMPLVVIKSDEIIVRTDWEAMLKTATEEELRGVK